MPTWTSRADIEQFGVTHTESGIPVRESYGPPPEPPPSPGVWPYTGGLRANGYRERPWTMRQYAGFGNGAGTNLRLRELIANGSTGLSVALDLPTQMGLDSDDTRARYEVGRVGVAIDTLADMEDLFSDIPVDEISTNFTINATAPVILAFYVAMADRRGISRDRLSGTVQNDLLKEFVARGGYLYSPHHSVRLSTDLIEFCVGSLPRWNPISIASPHMRSAGATSVMADGFLFANAIAYCEALLERGLAFDDFAPQLSFSTAAYMDVFETVARFRAVRAMWAEIATKRFGAQNPRSSRFRSHSGGDIDAMTTGEPINNVARMALNAFAAAAGGCQSLQVPCYDEAYEIPTDEAILNALRVQQIVAHESGVRAVPDPFAGSYYIEALTAEVLDQLRAIVDEVTSSGGAVEWIADGRMQSAIAREARVWEERVADGREVRVAMNSPHRGLGGDGEIKIHEYDEEAAKVQVERLVEYRAKRDLASVERALAGLDEAARGETNVMELLVDAGKAGATMGEITQVFQGAFGDYKAPAGI